MRPAERGGAIDRLVVRAVDDAHLRPLGGDRRAAGRDHVGGHEHDCLQAEQTRDAGHGAPVVAVGRAGQRVLPGERAVRRP